MKDKVLVYSPNEKILFRDFVETKFYSDFEKYYDVTWIFPGKLKYNLNLKGEVIILKNKRNFRYLIWTILFYLEELRLYSFWKWPNLNNQLYLSKKMRFFIKSIYYLKFNIFVSPICKFILSKTFTKYNFFNKKKVFVNINGGKDLLSDDLTRNAKMKNIRTISIPAGWDNVSSKPFLQRPDEICVWGEQTQELCFKLHKIKPHIIGTAKFDIYKKKIDKNNAKKKFNLSNKYKYLLVCGSGVAFNEKKFINKLEKFLIKKKLTNYKIIYRPHPYSHVRKFDEEINYKNSKIIIKDPSISNGFKLKNYPFLMSAIEGVITPYSTMVTEALNLGLPCLALGYSEKNYNFFQWRSFVQNAPHLKILKNKKFIVHCLEIKNIDADINKFFNIISLKKQYKEQMKTLADRIVFQSNKKYAHKLNNIILNENV